MSAKKTTCDSMTDDMTKEEKQRYSIGEEIANSVTHGVGAGLAIEALVLLTVRAASRPDVSVTSYVIFGVSLIVLYLASTLYHALPAGAKNVFGIFDHASIFILIAGTYTPYCLSILKGALGWTIFGIIWGLAVLGIVLYAVFGRKARAVTTAMYIIMGWLIIFATGKIKSMIHALTLRRDSLHDRLHFLRNEKNQVDAQYMAPLCSWRKRSALFFDLFILRG